MRISVGKKKRAIVPALAAEALFFFQGRGENTRAGEFVGAQAGQRIDFDQSSLTVQAREKK